MDRRIEKANVICDPDCRHVNGCDGHGTCDHCGDVFCAMEFDEDGLCPKCASMKRTCANCEESFFEDRHDGVFDDEDGLWFCSAQCAEEYEHAKSRTIRCDVCGEHRPESEVVDWCCRKCLKSM